MTDEQIQIVDTVSALFAALKVLDFAALEACVRPGFFIHENGKRFDTKGIFALMENARRDGAVMTWNIHEPIVFIDGELASVAYLNRGGIERKGEQEAITWLETATLTRMENAWRVAFMSSMRGVT